MRIKNMNQKRNSFNKNKNIINQININNNNQFWEKNEKQKNKNNSNYNNNYDTNTNNISKNKFKNEKKNDIYDIVFLPKYHSPIASHSRLIRQETTNDGKIIKEYQNKKEIIFPNIGLRKEIYDDGYQISYFKNKDIKQLYPDGKEVYFYSENHTVATKFPNGLKVGKFANGQIEKNFPDET